MTVEHQIMARLRSAARRHSGSPAARGLRRILRPLLRGRERRAELAAEVARLRAELDHTSERHTEQIERLEDLVRELVLAAEALRRASSQAETGRD